MPAAIARAYYVAMQPPCGPTFVSVPIDDWTHPTQAVEARSISREIGPDPAAMTGAGRGTRGSKNPALVVGPGVDRAQAVDLMVQVAEKSKAAVWVSPFSARCSFPERHPQFAGFLHASPAQLSEALRAHDLVVVIGAPVFTFHVEGHASIFDGATTIFQITDDPDAAAVTPRGTSIIATMRPALAMLLDMLPEPSATCRGAACCRRRRQAADPIPWSFCCTRCRPRCPTMPRWSRKRPRIGRRCRNFCRCAGRTVSTPWRAAALATACLPSVGMALGRPGVRTVCLIGDGSAMYSIQALWTAAQRKLPLTVVVINNAGYGAMRSFSQVMQVRNVPGLDLPGIDFVKIAESMGCDAVRVTRSSELAPALKRALSHDGTSLVEVMVDSSVPLLYAQKQLMSETPETAIRRQHMTDHIGRGVRQQPDHRFGDVVRLSHPPQRQPGRDRRHVPDP